MSRPAGSSRLLRAMNETAALAHLFERGQLTRGELRELTGRVRPMACAIWFGTTNADNNGGEPDGSDRLFRSNLN